MVQCEQNLRMIGKKTGPARGKVVKISGRKLP